MLKSEYKPIFTPVKLENLALGMSTVPTNAHYMDLRLIRERIGRTQEYLDRSQRVGG